MLGSRLVAAVLRVLVLQLCLNRILLVGELERDPRAVGRSYACASGHVVWLVEFQISSIVHRGIGRQRLILNSVLAASI